MEQREIVAKASRSTRVQRGFDPGSDARGSRKVIPFERVRIGCIPTRHAANRRFEVIKTALLHQRRQLAGEAAEPGSFMDDDAAPGFLHRCKDGVNVERDDASEIDDLRIDAGAFCRCQTDVNHGAVSKHGNGTSFTDDSGLPERNAVVVAWYI